MAIATRTVIVREAWSVEVTTVIKRWFYEYFWFFTILIEREDYGILRMTVVRGSVLLRHVNMEKEPAPLMMNVKKVTIILVVKQIATVNIMSQPSSRIIFLGFLAQIVVVWGENKFIFKHPQIFFKRNCHNGSICSYNQKGCYYDSDCAAGLYCSHISGKIQV